MQSQDSTLPKSGEVQIERDIGEITPVETTGFLERYYNTLTTPWPVEAMNRPGKFGQDTESMDYLESYAKFRDILLFFLTGDGFRATHPFLQKMRRGEVDRVDLLSVCTQIAFLCSGRFDKASQAGTIGSRFGEGLSLSDPKPTTRCNIFNPSVRNLYLVAVNTFPQFAALMDQGVVLNVRSGFDFDMNGPSMPHETGESSHTYMVFVSRDSQGRIGVCPMDPFHSEKTDRSDIDRWYERIRSDLLTKFFVRRAFNASYQTGTEMLELLPSTLGMKNTKLLGYRHRLRSVLRLKETPELFIKNNDWTRPAAKEYVSYILKKLLAEVMADLEVAQRFLEQKQSYMQIGLATDSPHYMEYILPLEQEIAAFTAIKEQIAAELMGQPDE